MRAATSRASMPERFSAQAVSAMPPAPALANRRVAMWPASVISVLARMPMRPEPSSETARKRTMWPTNDSASSTSASASHHGSPWAIRRQTSGRPASAGAMTTRPATSADGRADEHHELPARDAHGERGAVLDGGHDHRLPRAAAAHHWASTESEGVVIPSHGASAMRSRRRQRITAVQQLRAVHERAARRSGTPARHARRAAAPAPARRPPARAGRPTSSPS